MQSSSTGPASSEGLTALGLGDRVHVVPFGVDTSFWTPGNSDVGARGARDRQRRPSRLGHACRARHVISAPVRIFTRQAPPSSLPENVTWGRADWYTQVLSDEAVRDLYRQASAVVVADKDVPQPSGQSVTLQAMATGRAVVLSRTRGLWAPGELRDGENVMLVPPADPVELAHTVNLLLDDRARATALGEAARASVLRDARRRDTRNGCSKCVD